MPVRPSMTQERRGKDSRLSEEGIKFEEWRLKAPDSRTDT